MTGPIPNSISRSEEGISRFGLENSPQRRRYDRLFESCPDALIQQSTYWAEAIRSLRSDEPIFLLYADDGRDLGGLPLYLFRNPLGNILTSVPQAGPLGGIFVRDDLTPAQKEESYRRLLGAAIDIAKKKQCITLTLITNPFAPDVELYKRYLSPDVLFENFTQYIDLSDLGSREFPSGSRANNLRRNLKKSQDAGLRVETCKNDKDFDAWYGIHQKRHLEIGAAPLNRSLLENLHRTLGLREKSRLLLAKRGDEIVAGCFYVGHRSVMDVFMLSMDSKFVESEPNFLITQESLRWARAHGVAVYNWQSSASRTSGVYAYKKQWGAREVPYYFVTKFFCAPEKVRAIGMERTHAEYPGHYLAPFDFFKAGNENARDFKK